MKIFLILQFFCIGQELNDKICETNFGDGREWHSIRVPHHGVENKKCIHISFKDHNRISAEEKCRHLNGEISV